MDLLDQRGYIKKTILFPLNMLSISSNFLSAYVLAISVSFFPSNAYL